MSAPWLAALCLLVAVLLARPPVPRLPVPAADVVPTVDPGLLARYRWIWSGLGGIGALTFLGGAVGLVAAPVVAVGVFVVVGRAEPPAERRRREAVRRDLPHVVALVAAGLRSGAAPADAVAAVCRALPGPASDRLGAVAARLELGGDPGDAWAELARDPELGPLGRTLARAHRTGAPVGSVVERLGVELTRAGRAAVEDRARAVGVKAAIPLGLCLLPAFVLIGIVPLVAGLLRSLAW